MELVVCKHSLICPIYMSFINTGKSIALLLANSILRIKKQWKSNAILNV